MLSHTVAHNAVLHFVLDGLLANSSKHVTGAQQLVLKVNVI